MSKERPGPALFVIDGHADTPQRFLDEGWNFTDPLGGGMLNLDTARAGGLNAEFFAIWVDPVEYPGRHAARALELLEATRQQVLRLPTQLALCTSTHELTQAFHQERFGVLLSLEGGHVIEDSLPTLRTFFERGVRLMTLTWSHSVGWADSSGDAHDAMVSHTHGLSTFGHEVIHEMNRLGMMVDVSHVSDETFWAVLEVSRAPVVASHSSARALTAAARNLTDVQLRALADTGGMAMVNFFPAFLDEGWRQGWNAQEAERALEHARVAAPFRAAGRPVPFAVSNKVDRAFAARLPRVPLSVVVAHLEHMIAVAGIEHVGIGSDFDGIPCAPEGLETAAGLPLLLAALRERGLSEADLAALCGGNLLRVFREVEAVATALREAGKPATTADAP